MFAPSADLSYADSGSTASSMEADGKTNVAGQGHVQLQQESNLHLAEQNLISISSAAMQYGNRKATATLEAVQQQIFQTSALISAEERKLLDAMEGNNVVSRAWTDNDRGYESNEELSTSEEVGSSSNLDDTDNDFFHNARQLLVNSRQKQMVLSSPAEKSPGQQHNTLANLGEEQIKTGKQQHTTAISFHDRQLLDAMLSADPLDILSCNPYSANRGNRSRNDVHRQQQNKTSCDKSQDEPNLAARDIFLDMPNQRTAGNDTFVEGEVVEGLQQIVKTVPVNATEEQKTHTEEKSWDDNVRRPPMRNAKLKQAAPTTSTKSKRSKKKS